MNYQFYIKMDGQVFGPYSLEEIKELPLLEDTLITESRLNGEWWPACEFDWEGLGQSAKESESHRNNSILKQFGTEDTERPDVNKPSILNAWNWGAFTLSWIWSVCNGIYWPLVIIVCNFIPYVGSVIGLGICIYLGLNGNKLAWTIAINKHVDVVSFTESQEKWNMAGIIVLAIAIIISLVGSCMAFL